MSTRRTFPLAGLIVMTVASAAPAQPPTGPEFTTPLGPHVGLKDSDFAGARAFRSNDKIVMTHYFYWYDEPSKAHVLNGDGSDALTTHPASLEDFSYRSASWHESQLRDMMAAGIDVALPVYWGAPSERKPGAGMHWSFEGLPPMVKAAEAILREGKAPPAFGLFYDTSTLQFNSWGERVDLTTDRGRSWFYASIRDFFSMIPPRLWALVDGRPVVVLYASSFAKAHDQSCIDFVKQQFARDFGGKVPYVIREVSWKVRADNVCAWGGAVKPNFAGVAEIGPGYDHSAVPGRTPLVVDREGGAFYERAWVKALRRRPNIVILETWNEFHEGTTLAASREHGRQYIDLTRKYVDMYRKGVIPPPPAGPYAGARSISLALGPKNEKHGLGQVEAADGLTTAATLDGEPCRITRPGASGGQYVYIQVDDSFRTDRSTDATIAVEYRDGAPGSLGLQYDSHDPTATLDGAYKDCPEVVPFKGDGTWKTATFTVKDARFDGSQNGGADFRLVVNAPSLAVRKVTLTREAGR
ncbi:DUF5010 domain-containing protein [Aquisphaera insulae]|uniref:DUF5010 domain-containing protein n=1 Tax=Aquisphaera insulae TaxID=2712864 RepID=UPI0013EDA455|nr:DUF5010 domain-containing protein [Aquisphaera insulae]